MRPSDELLTFEPLGMGLVGFFWHEGHPLPSLLFGRHCSRRWLAANDSAFPFSSTHIVYRHSHSVHCSVHWSLYCGMLLLALAALCYWHIFSGATRCCAAHSIV
eukprot:6063465-Amphidinium_carterae.1